MKLFWSFTEIHSVDFPTAKNTLRYRYPICVAIRSTVRLRPTPICFATTCKACDFICTCFPCLHPEISVSSVWLMQSLIDKWQTFRAWHGSKYKKYYGYKTILHNIYCICNIKYTYISTIPKQVDKNLKSNKSNYLSFNTLNRIYLTM